ncbi:hypothetical protein [Novosphingobium sp. Leaf2]|uniref:hypothetical protein n=1 Tax=Novosphingobium sp. Leaf2 TaxID=1735670 RepID=UPI000A6B46BA|nr:hypothetical protein [Novosphingobium sp. Leaf2]
MPANIIPRAAVERITIYHGSLNRRAKGLRFWFAWLGFDLDITCTREVADR